MTANFNNLSGNTDNISRYWLGRVKEIAEYTVPKDQLISDELAQLMAEITQNIGVEIAIYLDRHGKVMHLSIGNKNTVSLDNLSKREGQNRLSGLRCVHTHPGGNGCLSLVDLTALTEMRFDAMMAIGVNPADNPDPIGSIGLAWGVIDGKPEPLIYQNLNKVLAINFSLQVSEIEKTSAKKQTIHYSDTDKSRAILLNITGNLTEEKTQASLNELEDLAKTAGLEVVDRVIQKRATPESATYLGKGKAEELKLICQVMSVDCLIFDDELSPVQMRNLENITGKAIIDRSMLILDIFAQRAQSNEGKLQVELAQLKYMMPRLVGQGEILSRLGGGIGTRGPGETKLEVDKRVIRKRIDELSQRLENVRKTRQLHRKQRASQLMPIVSLVGYTNAGKSTILNLLTQATTLAEDMLFATLDTTTRKLELPEGKEILLTDTVGFIRKLPHHLVAAFRATLEEITESDLLLHVIDANAQELEGQLTAVNQVLASLECESKPTLMVINKIDTVENQQLINRLSRTFDNSVAISAKSEIGIDELLAKIQQMLPQTDYEIDLIIPYQSGNLLSLIHQNGNIHAEEYQNDGTLIKATVPAATYYALVAANLI